MRAMIVRKVIKAVKVTLQLETIHRGVRIRIRRVKALITIPNPRIRRHQDSKIILHNKDRGRVKN